MVACVVMFFAVMVVSGVLRTMMTRAGVSGRSGRRCCVLRRSQNGKGERKHQNGQ